MKSARCSSSGEACRGGADGAPPPGPVETSPLPSSSAKKFWPKTRLSTSRITAPPSPMPPPIRSPPPPVGPSPRRSSMSSLRSPRVHPMAGSLPPVGRARGHAQFAEHDADGVQDPAHLVLSQGPDAADAEAVGDGELARVDHVAAVVEPLVERLEVELGIGRHAHRDDDRRLQPVRQEGLEAERAKPLDQPRAVAAVARPPPGDAALGGVLVERPIERRDG